MIEVATFRRQVAPGEEVVEDGVPAPVHHVPADSLDGVSDEETRSPAKAASEPEPAGAKNDHLIHHDNTFGTPEQDAFRRDFTINALFYDIANFSVIDYVDGLEDLQAGIVRSIGDPEVRFREDPVRMMRAVALAARLDFTIDPRSLDAIRIHRHEIARSSAPRLLEEYYKILRAGASERTFRDLARLGLLEPISEELHRGAAESLWQSLAEIDAYRRRFDSTPDVLTNAILLGTLIVPLGLMHGGRTSGAVNGFQSSPDGHGHRRAAGPQLGQLPLARRDIERLRQLLAMQRRLHDFSANPRAKRALSHRSIFREALAWMEVHGGSPDTVEHWKALLAEQEPTELESEPGQIEPMIPRRRRRRRRRRSHPSVGH